MLPQTNATLTAVRQKARTEVFRDAEEGASAALWTGAVAAYYQEKRERVAGAGAESLLIRRTLIVEEGQPAPTGGFESEQTVEFAFGGGAQTGTILDVERRVLGGFGEFQTTRLTLEAL